MKLTNKLVISTHLSMISLTVSGLNAPIKRYSATECKIERKNKFHIYSDYKRLTSDLKTQTESEKMEKSIPCKWK